MRVRKLQLAKLFPTIKQAQGSIGDLNGLIELAGTGDSVGKLLGSANGKIGVYMDEGKISRFLMELVALDLWDAARVKLKGDEEIDIRCAIADFGVKGGVAQANAFVFDTTVVNVGGSGTINLKTEEMDLTLKPEPKDRGIGSLRTPLHIKGTFSEPDIGPDMGKLAARGGGAHRAGHPQPAARHPAAASRRARARTATAASSSPRPPSRPSSRPRPAPPPEGGAAQGGGRSEGEGEGESGPSGFTRNRPRPAAPLLSRIPRNRSGLGGGADGEG